MKKSTISLSLLLLVGASCLTSCNKAAVKPLTNEGKSVLFTINDKPFYADDLLNTSDKESNFDFFKSEEGSKLLYSEIEKAVIKEKIIETDNIKNAVDLKMEDWKEQVKQFAQENNLTERLAEQSMLTEKGFETRDELRESYVYEEQKAQFIKEYQDKHLEPKVTDHEVKLEEDNSLLKNYVQDTNPMVMKHVLVKIESTDNVFNQAEITEAESDKLGTVVKRLATGNKSMNAFTKVAIEESQDDGSAKHGGNLGIVDEYTSFVDEFKYGVYASLAYNAKNNINQKDNEQLNIKNASFEEVCTALNLDESLFGENGIYEHIGEIEVSDAYEYLINQKDETVQDTDKKEQVNKYPRNIEFNKEFNAKGAQYLKVSDKAATATKLGCSEDDLKINDLGYVVDENNNPIVVVRSEFGIHFISVTYNSFAHTFEDNVKYFMTDRNLSTATENNTYFLNPFFNIGHTESTYTIEKNRKKEIQDRVINYVKGGFGSTVTPSDDLLNYKIFKDVVFGEDPIVAIPHDKGTIGEAVYNTINKFVNLKITANDRKIFNAHETVIEDYIKKIEADKQAYNDLYVKKGA